MSGSLSDIEKDIEASRARLDQTIDRIQDRLTTDGLIDEMLGSARRTPLNGFYDTALQAVRRNPLPVLLIAAGVTMLLGRMKTGGSAPAPLARECAPALRTGSDFAAGVDPPGEPPARKPGDRTPI